MFSRLSEWAARLISGREGETPVAVVSANHHGLVLRMSRGTGLTRDEPVAWQEVEKVLAFNQPLLVGVEPALWVLRGGGAIQLTPQVPGWDSFLQACETHLPGSLPSGLWQTRLLAGDAGQAIEVFSATPGAQGGAP